MSTGNGNSVNRVSPATKLAYGVGALNDSLKTFSFSLFLLFYYTTVLGLPGTLLGLAMSAGLVWDAAVDPLIGHVSDRARIPLGRRHGLMLVGALCSGASFVAVFNPPAGLSTGALFAWLMVSSLCLRSGSSLFMVPHYALGAELATDYQDRTSIAGYRAAAVLAGTLLAMAAAFLVFLPDGGAGAGAKFERNGYESMGVAFGLAMTAFALIATLGTLHARARLPAASAVPGVPTLSRTVLGTLRNRSFRILLASSSLAAIAAVLNAALAMHFYTYHVRIEATQTLTLYFVAFYGGALAGVLAWVRITRSIEKHHVYAATTVVAAAVISGGYWLVGEGRPLGTGHSWILVAGNALGGFFGTSGAVIVPSMLADVTAQDQLHSGVRRDGIFFGLYSFAQQLSTGLAVLVAGLLVDRFAGLVPGQTGQSAATAERLAMISNLLPAAVFVLAGVIALRYGLTRREAQHVHGQLAASVARPGALAEPT